MHGNTVFLSVTAITIMIKEISAFIFKVENYIPGEGTVFFYNKLKRCPKEYSIFLPVFKSRTFLTSSTRAQAARNMHIHQIKMLIHYFKYSNCLGCLDFVHFPS